MTVISASGDTGGDLASPTPAHGSTASEGVCSPEWLSGSRFWALQASDGEDEEEGLLGGCVSAEDNRYLCRTPLPVSDADLIEDSAELSRRQIKRIKRRDDQRRAARAAWAFMASRSSSVSSLSVTRY
jgi:hypothetical protein